MRPLEGKLALITVAGTATTASGAEQVSKMLMQGGFKGRGFVLNVTDEPQMEQVLDTAQAEFGRLYALVNNAGITRDNLLMRMKDSEWDEIMETNLKAVFRLCRLCMRELIRAREGRIINVVSLSGEMGNPGQTNYAAAKAGVIGFSKSLAREIASRNVTVNCVAPGFIDTDMTRGLPEAQRQAVIQHIPLGRLGQPAEVAAAVAFLASPLAAYMTGTTIDVNGGMLMR
jgi:3-oxoacyl-[acyl-carrier protein] reductase